MPSITVQTVRNTLIEFFPYPERNFFKGEPYDVAMFAHDVYPIDIDNALGRLFTCIRTTGLPQQNPGTLLVSDHVIRFGGLLYSGTLPVGGFGTIGIIFQPYSNLEGTPITLTI